MALDSIKNILVLNLSAIGDAVSSSVVINYLKKKYGAIDLAVPSKTGELFSGDPSVNLIDLKDAGNKSYDLFIDLSSSKASRKIARNVKAKVKLARIWNIWQKIMSMLAYNAFVAGHRGHIVKDYYPILEYLGCDEKPLPELVKLNEPKIIEKINGIAAGKKIAAMHIGSQNKIRIIPEELSLGIIEHLKNAGAKVLLLGTEAGLAQSLVEKSAGYAIYEELSLADLRSAMPLFNMFIGPDSGLLHMAASFGVKSIGVYGPTLASNYAPPALCVSAVEKGLACREKCEIPCRRGIECLRSIDLSEITRHIKL